MFLSSFYIFFSSFLKVYLNCTVNLELRGGVGGGGGGVKVTLHFHQSFGCHCY